MADVRATSESPRCLACGHVFAADELAAITARSHHEDLSLIECSACHAHNVATVQLQSGMDHHPMLVVLRIARSDPDTGQVFHETVERGVQVDPTTAGESH